MNRWDARVAVLGIGLSLMIVGGCSERAETKPQPNPRAAEFRKIRFANDWVVISFRSGLKTETVPDPIAGFIPRVGDRVVLSDAGDGELFLAGDLDALKFYHSSPKPDQLGRFQKLADLGRLFVVARGTTGSVAEVVEGELPDGLRAIELNLPGDNGGIAWVSDPFVRRLGKGTETQ